MTTPLVTPEDPQELPATAPAGVGGAPRVPPPCAPIPHRLRCGCFWQNWVYFAQKVTVCPPKFGGGTLLGTPCRCHRPPVGGGGGPRPGAAKGGDGWWVWGGWEGLGYRGGLEGPYHCFGGADRVGGRWWGFGVPVCVWGGPTNGLGGLVGGGVGVVSGRWCLGGLVGFWGASVVLGGLGKFWGAGVGLGGPYQCFGVAGRLGGGRGAGGQFRGTGGGIGGGCSCFGGAGRDFGGGGGGVQGFGGADGVLGFPTAAIARGSRR